MILNIKLDRDIKIKIYISNPFFFLILIIKKFSKNFYIEGIIRRKTSNTMKTIL